MTPVHRLSLALAGAAALAGCATTETVRAAPPALDAVATAGAGVLQRRGADALRAGRAREAIPVFAELAARNPRDSLNQTLLALAYHQAGDDDPEAIELALAGYDLALRAEPGAFWPASLAGKAAFDRGRYDEATRRFAQAVMARPSDPEALLALAAAAYRAGDVALAAAAAERAGALFAGAPAQGRALRLAALANAASGDASRAQRLLGAYEAIDPAGAKAVGARVAQLIQTAPVDGPRPAAAPEAPAEPPSQISVDVTIVLSQNTARDRIGINLLDGLRLQYGLAQQETRRSDHTPDSGTFDRVIVETIGVPQLNYNLNIFNRSGQYYQVVARPTLSAYLGQPSEFFVGRTVKVAVSGVNLGQLEQVDVGIELKVTPIEITADGARVRIETGRSFLTNDQPGTFSEALTTFRQRVAATAELRFGETLLLSGLSESVDDSTYSKTPVVGDLPGVGSLFNDRQKASRRDAVLILVTPSRPVDLPGRPWARAEAVERLAGLWTQVVDPSSNGVDAAARLSHARMFTRMAPGDSPLAWPNRSQVGAELLGQLLAPGR